jgi:predicted ArsR family transcriptional regulator
MAPPSILMRFLGSTRSQIVALLRRGARTVEDLAGHLGLTDNAVRSHISSLERDGIVRQEGVRRHEGAGKPATIYRVHPDAEPLFSRAYVPLLKALLDELREQLPTRQRQALMKRVGRRVAGGVDLRSPDDFDAAVKAGVDLLNALGGEAQAEPGDGMTIIRGCGCPLSAVTANGEDACQAVQALLSEVTGRRVRERCDHGERPQCRFEVFPAA